MVQRYIGPAMTTQLCPKCDREDATKALADMSPLQAVHYYRCEACGHVWITFKDGRPMHHVTPLPDVQQAS